MTFMQKYLYHLFITGFICSLLLALIGKTHAKQGLEVGCSCVMLIAFLSPIVSIIAECDVDLSSHTTSWDITSYTSQADSYIKQVMEGEYAAYILSKAEEAEIPIDDVFVTSLETEDAIWIPYAIHYQTANRIGLDFKREMEKDLGVPIERQKENEASIPQ